METCCRCQGLGQAAISNIKHVVKMAMNSIVVGMKVLNLKIT